MLSSFWGGAYPVNIPLWFIRDLMVVVLCSPLVYCLVRYGKAIGVLILGGLWLVFSEAPLPSGISIVSFFFFSAGAWFSINRRSFVDMALPLLRPATVLYVLLVVASTLLCHYDVGHRIIVHNMGIIAGIVTAVAWVARGIGNGKLRANPVLAGSSFFVYAYHLLPLGIVQFYGQRLLPPTNDLMKLAFYFGGPCVVILIGIGLYVLLSKYLPAFTRVITGGR